MFYGPTVGGLITQHLSFEWAAAVQGGLSLLGVSIGESTRKGAHGSPEPPRSPAYCLLVILESLQKFTLEEGKKKT